LEAMIKQIMKNMSKEDKQKMLKEFMASMSDEEKEEMMRLVMPIMMKDMKLSLMAEMMSDFQESDCQELITKMPLETRQTCRQMMTHCLKALTET
jgi:Mg/Co/Ni transporter MgtE